ncbi:delta(24)-sterol C-methyltransferase [Clostridium botulinum C]|nr:delta(24)-sterol C-methyltransferase [Clostridium botulinum C]
MEDYNMKNDYSCNNYLNLIDKNDSFSSTEVKKALNRITKAVNEREKIVICGSYDLDGITSVSLLMLILKYLNADVEYYIPDTLEKSDIFNCNVIENHITLLGASLIITVGCGINSVEEVELCRNLGIDVIITDYHKPKINIPNTIVINPNRKDGIYSFENFNAVGIVYKLACAIAENYHMKCVEKYLDLVAIGIASSNVPLVGETLDMLEKGMSYMVNTNNHGIKAITKINNIKKIDFLTLKEICNIVMPKVNAVGRMDDARIVVELFTTSDSERAKRIAKYINKKKECELKKVIFHKKTYNY